MNIPSYQEFGNRIQFSVVCLNIRYFGLSSSVFRPVSKRIQGYLQETTFEIDKDKNKECPKTKKAPNHSTGLIKRLISFLGNCVDKPSQF
jgi:hypothetical protein